MSRICVKNLPPYVNDEKLKAHFAARGEVTDAKVISRDGISRQLGFVGFRTEEDALAAVKYFHRSFFDSSRLWCEVAQPIGDPNLPRPWSRHSQGSSAFEKKHHEAEPSSLSLKGQKNGGAKSQGQSRKEEDHPQFAEFMEVMQPRSKSKLWTNDTGAQQTLELNRKKGGKGVKGKVSAPEGELRTASIDKGKRKKQLARDNVRLGGDANDERAGSSGLDINSTKDERADSEGAEPSEVDELVRHDTVSDLEYLKSRVKGNWSDDEEDQLLVDGEGDDQNEDEAQGSPDRDDRPAETSGSASRDSPLVESDVGGHEERLHVFDGQESVSETGRLFVRNLPYTASEEDLRELFGKYGELSEVHLVLDRDSKLSKGLAFILYTIPEAAVRAMEELDKSSFQGRLIHILPAKRQGPIPGKEQTISEGTKNSKFNQKKQDERKAAEAGGNTRSWNAFFMNPDTVAESVAQQYGLSKGEFLDPEADDLAVRLALGETHIIAETKRALSREGINVELLEKLASVGDKDVKRSGHVVLVKNLPFTALHGELVKMFNSFGTLGRVVLPPTKTLALVEFLEAAEARRAFKGLAYKRFKHVPLYLEWAPEGILTKGLGQKTQESVVTAGQVKHVADEQLSEMDLEADVDPAQARSLFVKNLNFSTSESSLKNHIQQHVKSEGAIRSVKISTKPGKTGKPLSMGFGFVELDSVDTAKQMCQSLQGTVLDGHALVVQLSRRSNTKGRANSVEQKVPKTDKKGSSTKIIIRNVAFEATKKDLKQLVSPFGQIKSLRLPKKYDGTHRGFAFVEFLTRQEAQNAFDALQSTHLYGRHLVLERAKEGETLDELRARTLKQMLENESAEASLRPTKKRRVLDEVM